MVCSYKKNQHVNPKTNFISLQKSQYSYKICSYKKNISLVKIYLNPGVQTWFVLIKKTSLVKIYLNPGVPTWLVLIKKAYRW